ncbi:Spy0128 family protein [Streptococcus zalophi]|uniref:Spy0128 family protein n=1 Tax=Streptococcus zalophi TaxID=640031 RepID=UPI00215B9305|nr:FctA domain-containing protein [Streptococcus zalophi]MCR8968261.1 SpaA isopeptide-forming pilin-related protein [Streptococcus zalophi]
MKKFIKATMLALLTFVSVFFVSANTVEAKELNNVVSDIIIWDINSDIEAPKTNGVYQLYVGRSYTLQNAFDLSAYDNDLEDGDFFTLDIPAPFNIQNSTVALTDPETGIEIGDVNIVRAGDSQGGTATVTLKNLQTYKDAKNTTDIINVTGTFFVEMKVLVEETERTVTFTNIKEIGQKNVVITSKKYVTSDQSERIKNTNFTKAGGNLTFKDGQYVHSWYSFVNPSGKNYTSLVLHDVIDENGAPMQFVPESLKVVRADRLINDWQRENPEELTEGNGYTVTYNASKTTFDITFDDPTKPHLVTYDTTAPADGATVINNASMTADNVDVTDTDTTTNTVVTRSRLSKVTQGGTISIETGNRITLYKTDETTGERLAGAIFKITKPDGTEITLDPTDAENGRTQSPVFTEAEIKAGEFTITEITAPDGYVISSNPIKVSVTDKGAIRTITNKKKEPKPVDLTISATKTLTGRELKADEFTFELKNEAGEIVSTAKNAADGTITFEAINFTKEGTYQYTIEEKSENLGGVTYDTESKAVTIKVTKVQNDSGDDAIFDGKLVATVTSEPVSFTNTYAPSSTSVIVTATKTLIGRELKADEFTFELKNESGDVVSTAKNAADGTITFTGLTFDKVGTYNYTLTEVKGDLADVTYDTKKHVVVVTVTDDQSGALVATVTSEPISFTNTYVTTTEEPTTSTTTTEEPTTSTTTTEEPTTSTTTTEEPTTSTTTTEEPTTSTTTTKKTKLPKTGENNNGMFVLIGLVLMGFVGTYVYRKMNN